MSIANLLVPNDYDIYINSLEIGNSNSSLNYFEEYNGDAVFSGAQNSTIFNGLHIQRVGDVVHLVVTSNSSVMQFNDVLRLAIPEQFIPTRPAPRSVVYTNRSGTLSPLSINFTPAVAIVNSDGFMTFYNGLDTSVGNFIASQVGGPAYDVSITYHIN